MLIAAPIEKHVLVEAVWWSWAVSHSLEKLGLSSLKAISMQRDSEMRFCNQWQSHISKVWYRTLSSQITMHMYCVCTACQARPVTHTERDFSESTSKIEASAGEKYDSPCSFCLHTYLNILSQGTVYHLENIFLRPLGLNCTRMCANTYQKN